MPDRKTGQKVIRLTAQAIAKPPAAPRLITRDHVRAMKAGAVIVDVAIDTGGSAEGSRPTTHDDPVFVVDGAVRDSVTSMPGAVPRTSTHALNDAILPFVLAIADQGQGLATGACRRKPPRERAECAERAHRLRVSGGCLGHSVHQARKGAGGRKAGSRPSRDPAPDGDQGPES